MRFSTYGIICRCACDASAFPPSIINFGHFIYFVVTGKLSLLFDKINWTFSGFTVMSSYGYAFTIGILRGSALVDGSALDFF